MSAPANETRLVDLMAQVLDLRERRMPVDLAMICGPTPDLLPALRAALAAHDRLLTTPEPPAAGDPLLGHTLGDRYQLVRRIGMGAMGSVFAAFDARLRRHVALKVVEPWVLQDPERRARFRREAQAVAGLRHPGIVAVHDHGEGDLPFLVMDLVPGVDLEVLFDAPEATDGATRAVALHAAFAAAAAPDAMARQPWFTAGDLQVAEAAWGRPWPALCAHIAAGIARALAHAHAHGVLHRDVKPSNVRLRPDGRVVLLDFGLARLPDEGSLTREGMMLGTLAYMSPEQVRGEQAAVSERADVYGLGATLYRLLTGRTPFTGESAVMLRRVLWDDPVPVRRLAPDVPRDLAAICHRALEKRPGDRYPSAAALAADLEAFLEFRPVMAAPPSTVTRVWRRLRRRPLATAVAVLLLIGLPAAAWVGQQAVHAAEAVRRRANARRAAVPALVTIEGLNPAYRIGSVPAVGPDPGGVAQQRLDAVLAADPGDVEALAMRAMLHLDCGRGAEGVADLRRLMTDQRASHFLAELVRRLAASTLWRESDWRTRLLADLPPAETAFELFLRAYLQLRAVRYGPGRDDVVAALALDPGYVPALHLLPLALLGIGDTARAADAARAVEGALGHATARTCHVLGSDLQQRGWYDEAVAACRRSLELCPGQHSLLNNLAVCLQKQGQGDAALGCVEQALDARPDSAQSMRLRLQILRDLGRYDEVARLAERFRVADGGPWWLDLELGTIALRRAQEHVGDEGARAQWCGEAVARLRSALAAMAPGTLPRESAAAETLLDMAGRLQSGDYTSVSAQMLLPMARPGGVLDPGILCDAALLRLRTGSDDGTGLFHLLWAHRLAPEDRRIGEALIGCLVEQPGFLPTAAQVFRRCFAPDADARADGLRRTILKAVVRHLGRDALPRYQTLLQSPSVTATPTPRSSR